MKYALVTGGNRGIGFHTCLQLANNWGYTVLLGCRDTAKVPDVANDMIHPVLLDVSSESSISRAALTIKSILGNQKLHLLVNNAGAQLDWIPNVSHIKTLDITEEKLLSIYRVNVFGPIFMVKYFLPMLERGCRIVNVASGSGEFWDSNALKDFQIGYAPSKSALIMSTKKLAAAVEQYGIVVNSCCPGWCRTSMGGANASDLPDDGARSVIQACFLGEESPPTGGHWRHGERVPIENYSQNVSCQWVGVKEVLTNAQNVPFFMRLRYLGGAFFASNYRVAWHIYLSRLFDKSFYIKNYPDIECEGIDPILHYVKFGSVEGRNPNSWFNTNEYLIKNPDVAESNINPFYHYVRYGVFENRML